MKLGVISGNDLPDILFISPGTTVDQLPAFLKAKCADLTPYLSGDAVKDYPNLANVPTISWRNVVFNNGIYGVPNPYPVFFTVPWMHQELLDQAGLALPKSADDFKKLLQALTKPQSNQWGIASANTDGFEVINGFFPAIFGAPNRWSLGSNGNLTHEYETDQFRQAVGYARDLYAAGVFHPNSSTYNSANLSNDFIADRFVFNFTGLQNQSKTFWDAAPTMNPPGKFKRNFRCTFEEDELGIRTRDIIGAETMMWANDYPHGDAIWPNSHEVLDRLLADCGPAESEAMLARNAIDLYRLNIAGHPELSREVLGDNPAA